MKILRVTKYIGRTNCLDDWARKIKLMVCIYGALMVVKKIEINGMNGG
jgi:hypothetical protein